MKRPLGLDEKEKERQNKEKQKDGEQDKESDEKPKESVRERWEMALMNSTSISQLFLHLQSLGKLFHFLERLMFIESIKLKLWFAPGMVFSNFFHSLFFQIFHHSKPNLDIQTFRPTFPLLLSDEKFDRLILNKNNPMKS